MKTLLEKIKSIPHLPLLFEYDYKRIEEEIRAMPYPLMQYSPTSQEKHNYYSGWNSLALYSVNGDIFCDPLESSSKGELKNNYGKYIKTGLSEYLPYTYEVLHLLGGGKCLARIEEVESNVTIGWHSHSLEFDQPESLLIVQLPISIPTDFKYSVVDYTKYRTSDFTKTSIRSYDSKYVLGTPYIFNSYHYHNVFNYSEKPALMIRFFVDIEDLDIKSAIESYSGDLIVGLPK
jgi:hypothetical protein